MATKKMVKKYENGGSTGNQKRTNTYEQTKTGYTGPGSGAMSINDIKATTSKTNRKGNTVTKTFTGSGAQAGDVSGKGTRLKNAASGTKTKTVTDAQGNVIKSKTKNISGNRATKKILNIRDRSNTSESYGSAPGVFKTGGMVNSNSKISVSKKTKGRSGGTSVAPKTAIPKAKLGMAVKGKYYSGGIAGDPPVQNYPEVTVTANKGKQTRTSKAKPKAMYGMAMKPGMMKKGGSKKMR